MQKNINIQIKGQTAYEEYLNALFDYACVTQATATKSVEEQLLEEALSHGRSMNDAMQDVEIVMNARSAVSILLKKAASMLYNSS